MTLLRKIVAAAALALGLGAHAQEAPAPADTLPELEGRYWYQRLHNAGYDINDPRIRYPKFAQFCVDVYNWADRVFNTFDPEYVTGSGRNWKLTLGATAWTQGYGYLFDVPATEGWNDRVIIRSNTNYDMGVNLSFMAVSVGYNWNINKLAAHNDHPRSTFNFTFNCSRFSAEIQNQVTEGNTYIERFGKYNDGRPVRVPFDEVKRAQFSLSAFYVFNHLRYSQAAVYSASKIQRRSAGSWLLGANYVRQRISIDFSSLPPDMLKARPTGLPDGMSMFNLHDFNIIGGYAYNVVFPRGWVLNATALPGFGFRYSRYNVKQKVPEQMLATNLSGRLGAIYNHNAIFVKAMARGDISFVFDRNYSFFSSTLQASLTVGVRF